MNVIYPLTVFVALESAALPVADLLKRLSLVFGEGSLFRAGSYKITAIKRAYNSTVQ